MQTAKSNGDDLKVTKPGDLRLPNFITSKLAAYWAYWAYWAMQFTKIL